jgi:8-amino-7-oxononanoate synthase
LVRHRAEHQPDEVAFTYLVDGENEQVQFTNRELDRQARAIAAWLQTHGLSGERALLLYPAGLEFIAAFFGCLYARVTAVPVYPPRRNRSMSRIQAIADDAQARVALTSTEVLTRVEAIIDETPHLKGMAWLATDRLDEGVEDRWDFPEIQPDTLAFLQYTSGSTGTPKGVVLNHRNLLHNSALISYAFEHTRSGSGVFWLPSYHDMGLIGGILQPLYVGRPNILMSPMAFLQKPFRWLSAISRFGGTTSGGPNFAYDLCVRKITPEEREQLDLGNWRVAFNGAEPVRAETLDRFAEMFAPCGFRREAFYPCFGLAEATLIVSGGYAERAPVVRWFEANSLSSGHPVDGDPGDEGVRALVGCGGALPDERIAIANPETLTRCAPGQIGEIWAAGPSIAQGYWRQAEATERTFNAYLTDTGEGPFLRTGDLGFFSDGELFVTGRIKDLIILRGVNIYPQDVERTVQDCDPRLRPDSGAAFTVEIDGTEQLAIVQEFERRGQIDFAQLFDAIRRAVSSEHEFPLAAIVLVKAGTIPKTSSGKIQRHACRAGFLDGSLAVVEQWRPGLKTSAASTAKPVQVQKGARARQEFRKPLLSLPTPQVAIPISKSRPAHSTPSEVPKTHENLAAAAEIVLEEVRRVARERASGLTLDTPIGEIGLDSLERMEILASIEERFGNRFPQQVLPDLETCQQVVEAVQKYLGDRPRARTEGASPAEVPAENYRISLFPEYVKLQQNLDLLRSSGLENPYFTVHEGITNDRTTIRGREVINFSSYNYVGTSGDPIVVRAAQEAAQRYGTSVSASRLASGEKPLHRELERTIADFVGVEDAVVLVGGHSTNESVIGHLFGPGDLILHDALSHNSILQGAILSGARRRPFSHNDWAEADRILREYRGEYRRVLIVVEGVYSMDGDIPDLPHLIEVKERHKALLMVDEAHSLGALGATGRGIGEHFNVDRRAVDIWMGTLSKSLGSCGGYIAGCRELVEYLKYTAPGFVFSVGISPPNAAAALAALRLLQAQPERVTRLQQRSRQFLELATSLGLNTGRSKDSPVVPVILGNSLHAVQLAKALFSRGINVQPILYPAVEESAARLRFFITSLHTEEQIRLTVQATAEELEKISPRNLAIHGSPVSMMRAS